MVPFFGLFCEIGRFSRALKMSAPTRYDEMQSESRWRFPHQSADWFGMTRCSGAVLSSANSNLSNHRTTPSGSGKERSQTRYVTTWPPALRANSSLSVCRGNTVKRASPRSFDPGGGVFVERLPPAMRVSRKKFYLCVEKKNLQ